MKFRINHFEERDGERKLVRSLVLRAVNALGVLRIYLMPKDQVVPVEGFACTNRYGEYREGATLVRAVACR